MVGSEIDITVKSVVQVDKKSLTKYFQLKHVIFGAKTFCEKVTLTDFLVKRSGKISVGVQTVYATFSKHRKHYFWLEFLFMSVHVNLAYKMRIKNKFNISKSF